MRTHGLTAPGRQGILEAVKTNQNLILGDCVEKLEEIPPESVDLVVTSPPYGKNRTYGGKSNFNNSAFQAIAINLKRVIKDGGVIVWVVGDTVENGSETLASFEQALFFKSIGLLAHDTMIYNKGLVTFPCVTRYHQCFEYMFIFSKGKPKTTNLIEDRKNKQPNRNMRYARERQISGEIKKREINKKNNDIGKRFNIWDINTGYMKTTKDKIAYKHPAIFPEALARDHIISWSNPGDTVLDPMMGSGTTGKMAKQLNRNFIGMEINEEYYKLAKKRMDLV